MNFTGWGGPKAILQLISECVLQGSDYSGSFVVSFLKNLNCLLDVKMLVYTDYTFYCSVFSDISSLSVICI